MPPSAPGPPYLPERHPLRAGPSGGGWLFHGRGCPQLGPLGRRGGHKRPGIFVKRVKTAAIVVALVLPFHSLTVLASE
jgi:hypothetical protein